jgi:hypothetical protein
MYFQSSNKDGFFFATIEVGEKSTNRYKLELKCFDIFGSLILKQIAFIEKLI